MNIVMEVSIDMLVNYMKQTFHSLMIFKVLTGKILMLLLVLLFLNGCTIPVKNNIQHKQRVANNHLPASVVALADFDEAMSRVKTEEYEKAILLLNKVIKESPNNAVPYINLALVYKKTDKLKQAEESIKLALVAEPENPVANNEYALIYRKTGRFSDARKVYENILDIYPYFNIAHKNLGILCDLYLKDYECALKHYGVYSDAMQEDKTIKIWIADVQNRLRR